MAYPRPVLSNDDAAKVRDMRTLDVRRTVLKILALFALWIGPALVALYLPRLLHLAPAEMFTRPWWIAMVIRLPFFLMGGFAIHGLGVLMHEAAHWNLFPKKLWNDLAGIVVSLPLGLAVTGYRVVHLIHHSEERSPVDPDELENMEPPFFRALVFYTWILVGMPGYVLFVFFTSLVRARNWGTRAYVFFNYTVMFGTWSLLVWLSLRGGWFPVLATLWIGPTIFATFVANIRGLAEHTMTYREEGAFRATRTTTSHPIVSWLMNNGNYHLEHHLFPDVAWHRLPELHKLVLPMLRKERAQINPSYLEYMKMMFLVGPLGRVENGPDGKMRRIEHPVFVPGSPTAASAGAIVTAAMASGADAHPA